MKSGNRAPGLTIFLVGVCLSIAQFVMVRDFVTILYGEELVIVLVTAAFFVGMSLGYLMSRRVSRKTFRLLFVVSIFLQLSFPFSYRGLAAGISAWDLPGAWFLVLTFAYALVFSSALAMFLPRLVDGGPGTNSPADRLKTFYTLELLGFAAGFLLVGLTWNQPLTALLPIYWVLAGCILYCVIPKPFPVLVYGACALFSVLTLDAMDRMSTALLYEHKHGVDQPKILKTLNSPYQKVEVVEDRRGRRALYLDGLKNLNSGNLEVLNHYIAKVPARLMRPQATLLIGNGTLSSVPKVYPLSDRVTSVELDPGVLAVGLEFFTPPESLESLDHWRLLVDDGQHFLKNTAERFDLVIMDVPSPLTIQEARLHTVEFYELVRGRLNPSGVLAVQLSGSLQKNNRTPARVVAALAEVFDEVMVIHSDWAERGFAYASVRLPFSVEDFRALTQEEEPDLKIIPPEQVRSYLKRAAPLTLDRLDLVLKRGWERFVGRYFDDD